MPRPIERRSHGLTSSPHTPPHAITLRPSSLRLPRVAVDSACPYPASTITPPAAPSKLGLPRRVCLPHPSSRLALGTANASRGLRTCSRAHRDPVRRHRHPSSAALTDAHPAVSMLHLAPTIQALLSARLERAVLIDIASLDAMQPAGRAVARQFAERPAQRQSTATSLALLFHRRIERGVGSGDVTPAAPSDPRPPRRSCRNDPVWIVTLRPGEFQRTVRSPLPPIPRPTRQKEYPVLPWMAARFSSSVGRTPVSLGVDLRACSRLVFAASPQVADSSRVLCDRRYLADRSQSLSKGDSPRRSNTIA